MSRKGNITDQSRKDDCKLIESFQAGKAKAFDKLVVKYKDMVFNLCFQILGDYDEANDSAQETFIKVYKNINKFRFESSFSTWLYRIAVNTCKNRVTSSKYKLKKKMLRIDNPGPGNPGTERIEIKDNSYSPDKLYEKNEKKKAIHDAIDSLPGKLKVLVILRDIEGKSYEEISEITGIKLGTVKSSLARARRNLREKLKGVI